MLTSAAAQLTTGRRLQARLHPQSCCLVHALAFCKEPDDVTLATSSLTTAVNQQVNTDYEVTNDVLPERLFNIRTVLDISATLESSVFIIEATDVASPGIGHGLRFTTCNLWFKQQLYK